ncbi:MAG: lysylphosphatidylglycerol synthase transmembrane domain-containing protein [Chloroflexota bacterium]
MAGGRVLPQEGRVLLDEERVSLTDIQSSDVGEPEVSLEKRFFNLRTLASFAIALAIIVYAVLRMDIDLGETMSYIARSNPLFFVLAIISFYLSFPVRALRWRLILRNVGFTSETVRVPSLAGLLEIILLSWFANCIVPAKLGDAYRGYLLKRNAAVSFSTTMGTIVAERIFDMLVLFGLLAMAGWRMFRGHLPPAVVSILLAGVALVAVLAVVLLVLKVFSGVVERILPSRLGSFYSRFSEGTLLSFQNLPILGVLTVAVWVLEAGRFWAVCQSLGIHDVGISVVFFIALASSLLTTLPITPAGLGVVETAVIAVLLLLGSLGVIRDIDTNLATSVAILDRAISHWSLIAVGLVLFVITKKK